MSTNLQPTQSRGIFFTAFHKEVFNPSQLVKIALASLYVGGAYILSAPISLHKNVVALYCEAHPYLYGVGLITWIAMPCFSQVGLIKKWSIFPSVISDKSADISKLFFNSVLTGFGATAFSVGFAVAHQAVYQKIRTSIVFRMSFGLCALNLWIAGFKILRGHFPASS